MDNSGRKDLLIGHVNIRSLVPALHKIELLLDEYQLDVLGITETWLDLRTKDDDIQLMGYKFLRLDRGDGRRGDGVGVFVRSNLSVDLVEECSNASNFIEQIWLRIRISNIEYGCGIVYRPPGPLVSNAIEGLERSLVCMLSRSKEIILMGDLNVDLMRHNSKTELLEDMLDAFSLSQLVKKPTRVTKTSASLLDIICVTNFDLSVGAVTHIDMHETTDHQLVCVELKTTIPKVAERYKIFRDFSSFNLEMFDRDMRMLNWQQIFYYQDIDAKVNILSNHILNLFDKHAPYKRVKVTKPKSPWLTQDLREAIKRRDKALIKFKRSRDPDDWEAYRLLRNQATAKVRMEKCSYLNSVSQERHNKKTWNALKTLKVYSNKDFNFIPPSLGDPEDINAYFIDSVDNLGCQTDPELVQHFNDNKFSDNLQCNIDVVSEIQVLEAVDSIKSNSAGSDGITLNMLKMCLPYISPYLTHIYNCCIIEGYFPITWRTASVLPIPKVTTPKELSDLKPVCRLPVLSKVLEKLYFSPMLEYLTDNNLLPSNQSGFRKGFSTVTALSKTLDDILRATDQGEITALILLDFSKAFDTLGRNLLLSKFHYYGFSEIIIRFFESYLSNRCQYVSIDGRVSSTRPVTKGVPQGSILGPLLFLLFTIDMDVNVKDCTLHQFADDVQVIRSFPKEDLYIASADINITLENIYKYSCKHGLRINPHKTAAVCFGNIPADLTDSLNLTINGNKIQPCDTVKCLGLKIDSKLRFRQHVNSIISKCYLTLKNLYQSRSFLTFPLRKQLCESLVLSHLNYADTIYGPCLDSNSAARIQRMQNACIRFLFSLSRRDHVLDKLAQLGWLNMQKRRKLHLVCLVHKVMLHKTPSYLCDKLHPASEIHNVNTRNTHLLLIEKHKTSLYKRSFSYNAASMYNEIPTNFKDLPNHQTFKNRVKEYLLAL
nr:unnamed protein product [Callosobruchus analis]